jgi:hypothetical protein
MSLSAVDCLRRGGANLAANWELVLVQWLGSVLFTFLFFLGLLPPLLAIGFGLFRQGFTSPGNAERALAELAGRLGELGPSLLVALLGTLAVWTFACTLYCFVQAGTFGVLSAGDRQAPPGPPPRDRRWFRTFSLGDFSGWGGRYLWRFCAFFGVAGLFGILWMLLLAAWLGFAAYGASRWGGGAGFGIGCGGALPVLFLSLLLFAWFYVAQADLARDGSGAWRAARRAFDVIGRRLGAVILLFVLFLVAAFALAFAFFPLSLAADVALRGQPGVRLVVSLAFSFLQAVPQLFLNLALAGALVALVRSEAPPSEAGA